jgi:4-hydroxyproline epimerase
MSERRQDFLGRFDWIRTGLVLEPRGHDLMSGGFLYPPTRDDTDAGILFIETSGCLPMCGHGTIGIVTFALENGLLLPREPGRLRMEVPAGVLEIEYQTEGNKVTAVKLFNVAAYLAAAGIVIEVPGLGALKVDVAYGGNFYAIIEPQPGYAGIDALGVEGILSLSPVIRELVRNRIRPVHPLDDTIAGVTHVLWADAAKTAGADGRNAVFYGERAIDRSPCGTGTSARMAQLVATGRLRVGDVFVHESIIGSRFAGRVERAAAVGGFEGIIPSIEGQAFATGFNTIWIDGEEPFPHGFQVV